MPNSERTRLFEDTADLQQIRAHLRLALGRDALVEAHRQRPWLDALLLVALLSLFYGSFVLLGFFVVDLWLVALLCVTQGLLIGPMALLSHDLFEHRQALRGWRQDWLAALLFLPSTTPSSVHRVGHLRHHSRIGSEDDTEASLVNVNSRFRRWVFCTAVGYLMARSGKWGRSGLGGYEAFLGANERDKKLKRRETFLLLAWLALNLILLFTPFWRSAVFGFLIPIAVIATCLSSIRIVLEHSCVDPTNPWSLATYYRSGWLIKVLFLADAGDCHLVHHIFPRVPWYNMAKFVRRVEPYLFAHNVRPSAPFWKLLRCWFLDNLPHRTLWR
jgi:fatty acid desaturase